MNIPASSHYRVFQSSRLMAFVLLSVGVHAGVLLSTGPAPPIESMESRRLQLRLEPAETAERQNQNPVIPQTDASIQSSTNDTKVTSQPKPEPIRQETEPAPKQTIEHTEIAAQEPVEQAKTEPNEKAETVSPTRFDLKESNATESQRRNQVKEQLQKSLKLYLEYPEMARRRGWEGEVTVSVQLDREGEIMDVAIRESSGHRILDDNTLRTLKNLPRLEWAGSMLDGNGITIQLPVIYQLGRI